MKILNQGFDHVEFVVHDILRFSKTLTQLGFEKIGDRKLPSRGLKSALFAQGYVRFLLTQPDESQAAQRQEVSRFLKTHNEGISTLALEVENATKALEAASHRGARVAMEPKKFETPTGSVVRAEIWTPGNIRYAFIERKMKPGSPDKILFDEALFVNHLESPSPLGVRVIDYVSHGIGSGEMKAWVEWYKKIFAFNVSSENFQQTVLQPEDGRVKILVREAPTFSEKLKGSGVQSLGLLTLGIQGAARNLKNGNFQLQFPQVSSYENMHKRFANFKENAEELKALAISAEGDQTGYLLQFFTKEWVGPFFLSFIERKNFKGFGGG